MLLLVGMTVTGFQTTEANNVAGPYVCFEITDNILGGTLYGDAPDYE